MPLEEKPLYVVEIDENLQERVVLCPFGDDPSETEEIKIELGEDHEIYKLYDMSTHEGRNKLSLAIREAFEVLLSKEHLLDKIIDEGEAK